jgi:hypothetical protein
MITKSVYTNFLSTLRILKSDDLQEIAINRILVLIRELETQESEGKQKSEGIREKLGTM